MSVTQNLGKVAITPQGTWSSANAYEKLDVVFDTATGSSYMAIDAVPVSTLITDTTYWLKLCAGFNSTDVTTAVNAWLVAHPEATTTVQDGAVTTAKLADGSVTDAKLASVKVDATQMQKCTLVTVPKSANLWNPNASLSGIAYIDGRILVDDTRRYIVFPAEEGHTYYFYVANAVAKARWTCAYDANGDALSAYGANGDRASFTAPEGSGVRFFAPTFGKDVNGTIMVMDGVTTAPAAYVPYHEEYTYYEATDEFLENTTAMSESQYRLDYMQRVLCNLVDPTFPTLAYANGGGLGASLNTVNGTLTENASYWTTDYIPVNEGETLYAFWKDLSGAYVRFICGYDDEKNFVSNFATDVPSFTVPSGVSYVRFSRSYATSWTYYLASDFILCGTGTPAQFVAYDSSLLNKYVFKPSLIPDASSSVNLHVYLPSEIPVGVGRTIELYNELVCLEAKKYHMRYSCSVGVQYENKWSVTGSDSNTGTYALTLRIYDDDMNMVWNGSSSVKIVADSLSAVKKVLPIGDSLTNLKSWLGEVETLSSSNIKYIGTRGRNDSTIRHEGRSGLEAAGYNEQFTYSFDSNYQGASGVSGEVNPFWDGSKFSLDYYNTQQGATVGTADAVQLFLGTNDVFGTFTPAQSAQNIVDLIDAIRDEDASIPIFVCNTIYRSNQSGYYSSGGQGFSAASGWGFDSDMKIMQMQIALEELITEGNYTNVFIVPLSICMDREHDFGQVEVAVNPRLSTVTEYIPNESVHPQDAGYMQIADVMYSSYIAHLT